MLVPLPETLNGSTSANGAITITTSVTGGAMIGLRLGEGGTINFSNNTVGGILKWLAVPRSLQHLPVFH